MLYEVHGENDTKSVTMNPGGRMTSEVGFKTGYNFLHVSLAENVDMIEGDTHL